MSYIGTAPTIGNFQVCDAISVVNGQASYTMQVSGVNATPQSANHMLVSLNGILQAPNSSFTVSGSTITFASNLVTGDVIDFIQILGDVLDLGVPSDNTVSLAKLTATGTKDATTFLRGDNTFAEAGGGKVLQVVSTTKTSTFSTSSTSFVEVTGLNVSITPSSTSNKILVMSSFSLAQFGGATSAHVTLYRDATNLGNASNGMNEMYNSLSGNFSTSSGLIYLDSPSSTSSLSYKIYARTGSGTAYVGNNSETSTITVMEIAG